MLYLNIHEHTPGTVLYEYLLLGFDVVLYIREKLEYFWTPPRLGVNKRVIAGDRTWAAVV